MDIFADMCSWFPAVSKLPDCIPATIIPLPSPVISSILTLSPILERVYFARLRETNGQISNEDIWNRALEIIAPNHSQTLQEFTKSLVIDPVGSFIRLSTRSPKDCLLKSNTGDLKITTAKEALYLLCSSNRIASDLSHSQNISIVLRPWIDLIDWSEMRVFVSNGKVTAASRYSQAFVESELLRQREASMLEFIQEVLKCLPDNSNCVIDVGLRKLNEKWVLIELNPFGRQTSGCLFSWVNDRNILYDGPYCLRV
jgi:hypothetical protein